MGRTTTIEAMAIGFYGGKWHEITSGSWAYCQSKRIASKQSYMQTKTIYFANRKDYNL